MSIKINSIQGISAMSANSINRWFRTNPDIANRNPNWRFGFQGVVAGYTSGGQSPPLSPPSTNVIDKFPFASDANATDVGDLTVARRDIGGGQSSTVSGYTSGGAISAPTDSNVIDKFPFASNANATDVGDLSVIRSATAGQSSGVSGYTSGGNINPNNPFPTGFSNVIDKFPFASNANATDVGDLNLVRKFAAGQSSDVSGYTSGGSRIPPAPPLIPTATNIIDKFPFATDLNATFVGNLSVARMLLTGQSSNVSGYSSGGYIPTPTTSNVIDKFPFATDANATDVGDLTTVRSRVAGQSSTVSGYTSGGSSSNVIDKFPFASNANATDVGDLSIIRSGGAGQQD
jgi:hypothetical protein